MNIQIVTDLSQLPDEWDSLLAKQAMPSIFMRRDYLACLQSSRSADVASGWHAQFILLWEGAALIAACPLYLKNHSWGEYVFDHAWANAYSQYGLDYYPKLVCAVPFTPVQGTRLLAVNTAARTALIQTLQANAKTQNASSVHVLFASQEDITALHAQGWSARQTVQFHWQNNNYRDLEHFLKSLTQDKAKKARAEMRKVHEAGVTWRCVLAADVSAQNLELLQRCYAQTYHEHGREPYLTPSFLTAALRQAPQQWLLCIASHPAFESADFEGNDFACSLIALDPMQKVAYGRYWGALARVSCLHFDACYYQPLQWCIAQGYARFEGGAQGEHKMARGLLPVPMQSAHYMMHDGFAKSIARFAEHEHVHAQAYLNQLKRNIPLRPALTH